MQALRHWGFNLRRRLDDLVGGLLFLPGLILAGFVLLALATIAADASTGIGARLETLTGIGPLAPTAVRDTLSAMATSTVTAVAMLFSILLVVQTLATTYSPRVLRSLIGDRTSQLTMGTLVGIVFFCFLVLQAIRDQPPFVPVLGATLATVFFLSGLALLVNFIHHISQMIQINNIVEMVARQTERAVDELLPERVPSGTAPVTPERPTPPAGAVLIESRRSGYIQSVDLCWLQRAAAEGGVCLQVLLPVGGFATRDVALVAASPAERVTPGLASDVLSAFRLGAVRTIHQDPDFGIRLLVDVALRAISPAVNDPSTAYTCVQQLGRLLVRAIGRHDPAAARTEAGRPGCVRLPSPSFLRMLDHAVTQIRQYSRGDFAVTLALLDVLRDLALETRHRPYLDAIGAQAELIGATRNPAVFAEPDLARIRAACRAVQRAIGQEPAATAPSE